ncbi:hypothetical protein [Streptacidiphilus cavernicola]|uniref:4Fe-4S Wbl-type domain-containing protein n=1 Tax=Streptacidiphilus cavernicola TaxID=3342716 RepID=A0ABV6VNT8_9ACTN
MNPTPITAAPSRRRNRGAAPMPRRPLCLGRADFVAAEGRWEAQPDEMYEELQPLAQLCRGCPAIADCLADVRPSRTGFDGVCAGRVWLNGLVVHPEPAVAKRELHYARRETSEALCWRSGTTPTRQRADARTA